MKRRNKRPKPQITAARTTPRPSFSSLMIIAVMLIAAVVFLLAGLHALWSGEVTIANRGAQAKLYTSDAHPFIFWWMCGIRFVLAAGLVKIAHALWDFDTPSTRR